MAARRINPLVRQVLELGPTLLFFGLYFLIKDRSFTFAGTQYSGFIVAALTFVPMLVGATLALWLLSGEVSRMQVITGLVVVVFAGLTAWFNDERFFKMKVTVIYGASAALLGIGLMRGESWLEWVLGKALPMRREGWMILTRRLALVFAALAILNEVIWRSQSTETWVTLKVFVFPALLFLYLVVQIGALGRFVIEPGAGEPGKD